jgi:polar amino acid transport system substrate-binding protein
MSFLISRFLCANARRLRVTDPLRGMWRLVAAMLIAMAALGALAIGSSGIAAAATAKVLPASAAAAAVASASAGASGVASGGASELALVTTANGLVKMPNGRLLAPEFARIASRGEIVVAVLGVDQPPFFERTGDQLTGFDIDLANEIAKKLGVKVRFNRDAWTFDGVVNLLANGQADIAVSKLSRTLPRAEVISFSIPYVQLHRALLLNRVKFAQLAHDRSVPEVIRTFDGTIGVVVNSSYADYVVTNFPQAKVVGYRSWDDVLKALNAGDVTAAYRDEFEVKHVLKQDPTASLRLRVVTLEDLNDTIAVGVNISSPALLAFVNQFLEERSKKLDVNTLLQATKN